MAYAEKTDVAPDKSRAEIEKTLKRYGAEAFGYMTNQKGATIFFQVGNYRIKFSIPLPPLDEFQETEKGRKRTAVQADAAREQEERRRWRALALCVKAKLEAVETGITTFEAEFMAHIVIPGPNMTAGELLLPKIAEAVNKYEPGLLLEWNP